MGDGRKDEEDVREEDLFLLPILPDPSDLPSPISDLQSLQSLRSPISHLPSPISS